MSLKRSHKFKCLRGRQMKVRGSLGEGLKTLWHTGGEGNTQNIVQTKESGLSSLIMLKK